MKLPARIKPNVSTYEKSQETMALLKILAIATRQIVEGNVVPAREAIRALRRKIAR